MTFNKGMYVLEICAFSCTYIAKFGPQKFLCAYFFVQRLYMHIFERQRLYVLIGHVLIKNECTLWMVFSEK